MSQLMNLNRAATYDADAGAGAVGARKSAALDPKAARATAQAQSFSR